MASNTKRAVMLAAIVILTGCSAPQAPPVVVDPNPQAPVIVSPPPGSNPTPAILLPLTEADIKNLIAGQDEEVISITPYRSEHVLVESRIKHNTQCFRFINLKTHDIDLLPTMGGKLLEIKDKNHIIFEEDGTNNMSPLSWFPTVVEFRRFAEVTGVDSEFEAHSKPKLVPIGEPVHATGKAPEVIVDLRVTLRGLELMFGPVDGKEIEFAAATEWIPTTDISYAHANHELVLRFTGTTISPQLLEMWANMQLSNHYIRSIAYRDVDECTELVLRLTQEVKYYSVTLSGALPGKYTYLPILTLTLWENNGQ